MPGNRVLRAGCCASLFAVASACSSESAPPASPDGGSATGGSANGGAATAGAANGGTPATGGAPATGGGASAGGTSGAGGAPGTGGATPECTPGCIQDCPQGCFDLGDCEVGVSPGILATPSVFTAGIVASGVTAAEDTQVFHRPAGASHWWSGQPLSRLRDGRRAGTLFALSPDTDHVVRLRTGSQESCVALRTLPETPPATFASELWVDAAAAPGGDGSASAPFRTIQAAVNAAAARAADIRIRAGVYREAVTVTSKRAAPSYLRLRGEAGAILDGSSTTVPEWRDDGGGIHSTPWTGDPRYVSRDGARLYHYVTRAGLDAGRGLNDVPIAEGYFVEGGRLIVRLSSPPAGHAFQIPALNTAIQLSSAEGVWIQGLQIRFYGEGDYGKGIDVTEQSSRVVVRENHVHDIPSAVWIRKGSSAVRIEDNEIAQSSVYSWPWNAVKATDHENDAVTLSGGSGAIVARNRIHDIFNGVSAGSFDDDENPAVAPEVDVFRNRLARVGDDGFEPEGACVNARFWENSVDAVHNGISLAPITFGPVYAVRNRFTDFAESGFKLSNDSSGPVFLFHNTCYTDRPDHNGMNVSGNFTGVRFRNNVIRGTAYAIELTFEVTGNDLDHDALYTPRGAPRVKWNDVRYDDITALCAATALECHGVGTEPLLAAPGDGRFAPATGSPLIDAAARLYGINDGYTGEGPDIGYVEQGAPEAPRL